MLRYRNVAGFFALRGETRQQPGRPRERFGHRTVVCRADGLLQVPTSTLRTRWRTTGCAPRPASEKPRSPSCGPPRPKGRLDIDELDERTAAAYTAKTRGELARLL